MLNGAGFEGGALAERKGSGETMTETVLGRFNLNDEIERFEPGETKSGRRAETLIKTDQLRVVLVTMLEGSHLQEHTAPGPITIHALRGRFAVQIEQDEQELGAGGLISIAPGVRHSVRSIEPGAFLLTIVWPTGASGEPAAVSQN
jgi:quercetin dioxygenase-like cupin family protein